MKTFALTPGSLTITAMTDLPTWEADAKHLFHMQRHVPWWLGDLVVYGEARFGDDIWQVIPEDVSLEMLERFAGLSRKYPVGDRVPSLSWTHHAIAAKAAPKLRRALLRVAESERMDTRSFGRYVDSALAPRDSEDVRKGNQ